MASTLATLAIAALLSSQAPAVNNVSEMTWPLGYTTLAPLSAGPQRVGVKVGHKAWGGTTVFAQVPGKALFERLAVPASVLGGNWNKQGEVVLVPGLQFVLAGLDDDQSTSLLRDIMDLPTFQDAPFWSRIPEETADAIALVLKTPGEKSAVELLPLFSKLWAGLLGSMEQRPWLHRLRCAEDFRFQAQLMSIARSWEPPMSAQELPLF